MAWKIFNNIDAGRDLIYSEEPDGFIRLGVDATKKTPLDGHARLWPDDIVMDDETKMKVTERWALYGLD